MQIIAPGQSLIAPRKKFHELYSEPLAKPIKERRLRITANTTIRGHLVWPGSVFAFDLAHADYYEDFACLTGSLKAEKVDAATPLFTAPAPVAPPPLPVPEKNVGTLELARALVTALKEASPKTAKA